MADALLLPRRFHAPSTFATSSSASSSPSFRWDFSLAALRGTAWLSRNRGPANSSGSRYFLDLTVKQQTKFYLFPEHNYCLCSSATYVGIVIQVHASVTESGDQPKWWEKNAGPNMIDIHSTQEFMDALRDAGDRLVIVEFYGSWCSSCRALFPRLCRTFLENPEIWFLKVNFDENKPCASG